MSSCHLFHLPGSFSTMVINPFFQLQQNIVLLWCGCNFLGCSWCKKGGDPLLQSLKEALLGTQCCICKLKGPRPWMSPSPARKRSDTPSVKHGCALEEGKMLNCVGISREKQQTWLDLLTISLSWDTIRRKPVSLSAGAARRSSCGGWGLCPGRQSLCDDVDAT